MTNAEASVDSDERLYRYAERDLLHAEKLLHQVKGDSSCLDIVLELQRHLIRCIVRTELRVQRLRRKRKSSKPDGKQRVPRDQALARKERVAALLEREKELVHLLFLWRCFGDGIAFVYQSKYSLKHTYYDGEYKEKESAGFMTEHGRLKRGFAQEYRILCKGIKFGVPVVLCDITNIIRYGDVCALGGPDPVPIEAKSSGNRNARTERQRELRQELAAFFANDGAPVFRGLVNVRREELMVDEVNYQAVWNDCVTEARRAGWCRIQPEPGLTYVAATVADEEKLSQLPMNGSTVVVHLSAEPDYLPSYPFTLSLAPDNCVAFMRKRLGLFVFIELKELKAAFARRGVHATMLMNGLYSIQITKTPHDLTHGAQRISSLMFSRIATEFLSLDWFAHEMSKTLEPEPEPVPPISLEEAMALPGAITQVPLEWQNAVDFWEQRKEVAGEKTPEYREGERNE
jgi:hypothetical protein